VAQRQLNGQVQRFTGRHPPRQPGRAAAHLRAHMAADLLRVRGQRRSGLRRGGLAGSSAPGSTSEKVKTKKRANRGESPKRKEGRAKISSFASAGCVPSLEIQDPFKVARERFHASFFHFRGITSGGTAIRQQPACGTGDCKDSGRAPAKLEGNTLLCEATHGRPDAGTEAFAKSETSQ
jgi:hypothetical protein